MMPRGVATSKFVSEELEPLMDEMLVAGVCVSSENDG